MIVKINLMKNNCLTDCRFIINKIVCNNGKVSKRYLSGKDNTSIVERDLRFTMINRDHDENNLDIIDVTNIVGEIDIKNNSEFLNIFNFDRNIAKASQPILETLMTGNVREERVMEQQRDMALNNLHNMTANVYDNTNCGRSESLVNNHIYSQHFPFIKASDIDDSKTDYNLIRYFNADPTEGDNRTVLLDKLLKAVKDRDFESYMNVSNQMVKLIMIHAYRNNREEFDHIMLCMRTIVQSGFVIDGNANNALWCVMNLLGYQFPSSFESHHYCQVAEQFCRVTSDYVDPLNIGVRGPIAPWVDTILKTIESYNPMNYFGSMDIKPYAKTCAMFTGVSILGYMYLPYGISLMSNFNLFKFTAMIFSEGTYEHNKATQITKEALEVALRSVSKGENVNLNKVFEDTMLFTKTLFNWEF